MLGGIGNLRTNRASTNKSSIALEESSSVNGSLSAATPNPTVKPTATPKPTEAPMDEEEETEVQKEEVSVKESFTLRDGKYIIGDDIPPGEYVITCIESDGETLGDMYSSMGDAYSKMGDDDGLGDLMNSLGGMMGSVITTSVEILGDYGTVLKSYDLKTDESISLTLSEETALQITGGKCVLDPK